MNELIKISYTANDDPILGSARDLYLGLGLDKTNWSRWSEQNIEGNEFFVRGVDWQGFIIMMNGNKTKDYSITLDFGKHIAMQAKTAKSHEYRDYMIAKEKEARQVPGIPLNLPDALRLAADKAEEVEGLKAQAVLDAPKVQFADSVSHSADSIIVAEYAKNLSTYQKCPIGPNKLGIYLRENKYLMSGARVKKDTNVPYQKWILKGWFESKKLA